MSAAVVVSSVVVSSAVVGEGLVRAVEAVGPWVWRASWQGAVLAGVVAVVLKVVGRRLSPGWRFGLWGLVLVRLAVPPVVAVSWWEGKGWGAGKTDFHVERTTSKEDPSPRPSPTAESPVRLSAPTAALGEGGAVRPVRASTVAPVARSWNGYRLRARATWAWIAGVALLAVRVIVSSVRLGRAVRRCEAVVDPRVLRVVGDCCGALGVRRAPAVRLLAAGGGPALVGWWRPVILLPPGVIEGMSEGELRLIVLHELAHVRRRDVLVNWLATAVAVVHWPNPAVWWVMGRMRFERELACDEVVLQAGRAAGGDRGAYARTIVRLAEALSCGGVMAGGRVQAVPAGGVGIIEGKAQLTRRLQMIARFDASAAAGRRWPVVAMGLSILVGAAALGGATRAAAPPAPPSSPAPVEKPAEKPDERTAGSGAGSGASGNPAIGDPSGADPSGASVPARAGTAAALSPEGKRVLAGLLERPAPPSDAEWEAAKRSLWQEYQKKVGGGGGGGGGGEATNPVHAVAAYGADVAGIARGVAEAKERGWSAARKSGGARASGPAGSGGAAGGGASDPASLKTAEKLKKPMQVQFAGQAFSDVIDFFRDVTGVDVLVQWQQLEAAGMTKEQPVTIHLREPTPAEAVLALMFRTLPVRLQFEIDHGAVVIGTVEDYTPATAAPEVMKVYDVSDLVGRAGGPEGGPGGPGGYGGGPGMAGGPAADGVTQLMRLIMTTVQPESWRDAGGKSGSITSFKGKLVIKATEAAHKEVGQLLEMLREGPGGQGGAGKKKM